MAIEKLKNPELVANALSTLKSQGINIELPQELVKQIDPNILFDGNNDLFKTHIRKTKIYFEYGCGKSTLWVASQTKARIYSVDTSEDWINLIASRSTRPLNLFWCDVGPLGNWGRPACYAKRENFPSYTNWLWQQNEQPDLVLIDGRFRLASFFSSVKFAKPGTRIIFDDYIDRQNYHWAEEVSPISEHNGRQALFIRPQTIPLWIDEVIMATQHVFD